MFFFFFFSLHDSLNLASVLEIPGVLHCSICYSWKQVCYISSVLCSCGGSDRCFLLRILTLLHASDFGMGNTMQCIHTNAISCCTESSFVLYSSMTIPCYYKSVSSCFASSIWLRVRLFLFVDANLCFLQIQLVFCFVLKKKKLTNLMFLLFELIPNLVWK